MRWRSTRTASGSGREPRTSGRCRRRSRPGGSRDAALCAAMAHPEQKRADAEYPIADVLAGRFSPRAFASEPPSEAQLARLFTAASWAPSAGNGQPWRFVVGVRGDDVWPVVLGCLTERNQAWCRNVPVLGIAIAQTLRDGKPLRTGAYDLGQALAHLTFQAAIDGLYVHQ